MAGELVNDLDALGPAMSVAASHVEPDRLYTRHFFQVFAAVMVFMTGVALQFHFGQYVAYLGHGVDTLGRILSISMVGTLLIRLRIGRWIDHFGCRPTWIVGTAVCAACTGAIQFSEHLWLITVLRAMFTMSMAAVMTTVAVFAARIAPRGRRAEAIGTIGLAGFLGIVIGPALGDWIFSAGTDRITPYRIFFSSSALCSLLAAGVMLPVRVPERSNHSAPGSASPSPITAQGQWRHVIAHWPGAVLLVGVSFSMAFCWQSMFLERFAEARGFQEIKLFFLIYGPTAMALRLIFRRLPEHLGRTRTLILGMLLLASGQWCLIGASAEWHLILPGFLMGAGHSFVFPSMVDLGADRFPMDYRGTGTALILAMGDVGMLIGYGLLGEIIDAYDYDTALVTLACIGFATAVVVTVLRREAVFFRGARPRTSTR